MPCCGPCERSFGTDRLDFELDDAKWKEVFAHPGGLFAGCGCCSPKVYLAFRATLLVVWFGCTIWSFVEWVSVLGLGVGYWFTKLTHWGAMLQVIYFAFGAFSTYKAIYGRRPDGLGEATPWFVRVTWFLAALAPVVAFIVLVLYWALVFDDSSSPTFTQVLMHGGNFLAALLDLMTTRTPHYIAHVYVPMAFGITYTLFTLIYYAAGGTFEDGVSPYIYPAIDWTNSSGTSSLLGLVVFVGLPAVYILLFCVVACRVKCRKSATQAETSGV